MEEQLILVDERDSEVGTISKMAAHREGLLHRAFSVFVFNSSNKLLLQRRSLDKYHSAGLWSNTCCSHPRPGETIEAAAKRRLFEEMGLSCELREVFSFIYHVKMENGLTEYEFDHVFAGYSDSIPEPDSDEVNDWAYRNMEELKQDIAAKPHLYSEWFKLCIGKWDAELFTSQNKDDDIRTV